MIINVLKNKKMKKLFIMASFVAVATFANAQATKTKTVDLGEGVSVTYSYYLDENGDEVRHGKLTVTEVRDNNIKKGKKTLTCNYQNGNLTGTLTYSCNMSHYEEYVDYSKGVDYNVTRDSYELSTKWKKVRDQKENFTVDMYEGYLNGDINISFNARHEAYQLLTIKGKANKGVLVDGSTLELKQDGETLESYKNTAPDINKAQYADYKAGNHYGTGQYQYYSDGVEIQFGFTHCLFDITLKYPRYTVPEIILSDIEYWQEYKSGKYEDLYDSICHIESIRDNYDLLPTDDKKMLSQLLDSLKTVYKQREQRTELQGKAKIKKYKELFPKVRDCYNRCKDAGYAKYNSFFGQTECTSYYDNNGKIVPVLLDENVVNIVCNEINKQRNYLVSATKINLTPYNYYVTYDHKEYVPENTDIPQYKLDTLENYLKRVSPERLDTLKLLRDNAQNITNKCKQVAVLYTKTTSSESNFQNYSKANCTSKITNKPIIYNAYIEIVGHIYKGIRKNSLTDLYSANLLLDKINDKMIQYSTAKTKDLENALNTATTEKKLKMLMQE